MKKTILSLASLMMLSTAVNAQQIDDEVTMGAGYANDVFYNLETQEEHLVANDAWDLAFYRDDIMDKGIKINDTKGWILYEAGDISTYDNIDIADEANWNELYNPDTDYTKGAFDQGSATFGWGNYNPGNHHTTGALAFVLTKGTDEYIKIKIDDYFGAYTFTYAEWDGTAWSDDVQETIANETTDSFHHFYSFASADVVTVEPGKATWDLLFTKYKTPINAGNDVVYYPVTGVLQSPNVKVAKSIGDDEANIDDLSDVSNTIGYDWKTFEGSGYTVDSETNYFIKRNGEETIYKLNFTAFEGNSTGLVQFSLDNTATLSVEQVTEGVSFNVYPNPTTDKRIQVVYDITATDASQNQIAIYALNGAVVYRANAESNIGFYTQTLDLNQLTAGVYILEFRSGNQTGTKKIVLK